AWLLDDRENVLVSPPGLFHADFECAAFRKQSLETRFQKGVGLPGRVWEANAPAWIVDVTQDTDFPRAPLARDTGLSSAFAFPIRYGQTLFAVFECLTLIMPERFRDAHQQGFKRHLETGEAHVMGKTVELAGRRKDGTEFPLELSLASWGTSEGIFFTGIIRDITERKRAEGALHESEQRFHAFWDNSPSLNFLKDVEGRYLNVNKE